MNHKGRIFFCASLEKRYSPELEYQSLWNRNENNFFLTDTRKFARPMGLGKIFLDAIEIKACNCKVPSPVKL